MVNFWMVSDNKLKDSFLKGHCSVSWGDYYVSYKDSDGISLTEMIKLHTNYENFSISSTLDEILAGFLVRRMTKGDKICEVYFYGHVDGKLRGIQLWSNPGA